ncbi:Lrp/AsnC family transcriptional regulator [Streptomyces sp. cmx-10-25]|uniref:Lrp/AsnC family transcriptional regulator n=1 Tax=Streptomyces sp. cmx-10-25 TaxID=2790919 RepID=UPI00397FB6C9
MPETDTVPVQPRGPAPRDCAGPVVGPDELDLALIEALQLRPHASWTLIGSVIGVDATTAARRWRRLTDSGTAWMTAYPAQHVSVVAYVDLECEAGAVDALTRLLCSWPPVFSVERTTGRSQLFLSVAARDLPSLDDLVTRRLGGLDGVRSSRVSVSTKVYQEGSGWLVGTLDERQRAALGGADRHDRTRPGPGPYESDRALLLALGTDARRGHAELARDGGMSDTTVRRRIGRMISRGEVRFRCDLAQHLAGWPVVATYRVTTSGPGAESTARALAALPRTRLCSAVTGPDNLLLSVWLRSTDDCRDLEERVLGRHPGLRIGERDITLHTAKRMGRLLDRWGRAGAHVPMAMATEGAAGVTTA